jgi:hypothetical protein
VEAVVGLVVASWADDGGTEAGGNFGLEVASGVALVTDDQLAPVEPQRQQPQCDVALLLVG